VSEWTPATYIQCSAKCLKCWTDQKRNLTVIVHFTLVQKSGHRGYNLSFLKMVLALNENIYSWCTYADLSFTMQRWETMFKFCLLVVSNLIVLGLSVIVCNQSDIRLHATKGIRRNSFHEGLIQGQQDFSPVNECC